MTLKGVAYPLLDLFLLIALSVPLRHLGDLSELRAYVFVTALGVRNRAARAILDAPLYVDEVAAALVTESKQRTAAEHTVEVITRHLVAGKVFTVRIFEIFTAVFHILLLFHGQADEKILYGTFRAKLHTIC